MTAETPHLGILRAATRQAHRQIETVPILARLMANDLTIREYVGVLRSLYAFHAATEPAIAIELMTLPDATALLDGARPRALAEDLAWYGAPPLPACDTPDFLGPSAAMGALYVIEGSGLGGRVIARHLGDSLGVSPGRGGSFYGRLDAETARRRWAVLTALLESPDLVIDDVIDGARKTFAYLERWLRTGPHHGAADTAAPRAEAELG